MPSAKPEFLKPIVVNSFTDPAQPKKLHPELIRFSRIVANVAVLDFSEKQLRAHYELDFYRAQINYVRYRGDIIAFFIAVFSKTIDASGNTRYVGTGFPGIKYTLRSQNKKKKSIDFRKIMSRLSFIYVQYYFTHILKQNRLDPVRELIMLGESVMRKGTVDWSKVPGVYSAVRRLFKQDRLLIKATAENPIMYAELMSMNLRFEGTDPRPSAAELTTVAGWDAAKLLNESFKKSVSGPRHPCLVNPPFAVNISASEWRRFFLNAQNNKSRKAGYIRYFLWQNFNFPDTAFQFHFQVDPKNILRSLGALFRLA